MSIRLFWKILILISIGLFWKISISIRRFWKISISIAIRRFRKISISIEYCIDWNLAYRTGLGGTEEGLWIGWTMGGLWED